jgi:hypothetical protein
MDSGCRGEVRGGAYQAASGGREKGGIKAAKTVVANRSRVCTIAVGAEIEIAIYDELV